MVGVLAAALGGALGTVVAYLVAVRTPAAWRWTAALVLTVAGSFAAGVGAFVKDTAGQTGHAAHLLDLAAPFAVGLASLSSAALLGFLWTAPEPGTRRRPAARTVAVISAAAAAAIAGYLLLSILYYTSTKLPRLT
ncbi:hypothetical protein GCM10023147_40790 [Tsukamurella soli]|uniref:Uncharacterized protein n=1 Tax=Tsukamurella soli TaxID=644556 RepID=A0ABP8K772_9ACTN